jgi:hypothetical protein
MTSSEHGTPPHMQCIHQIVYRIIRCYEYIEEMFHARTTPSIEPLIAFNCQSLGRFCPVCERIEMSSVQGGDGGGKVQPEHES